MKSTLDSANAILESGSNDKTKSAAARIRAAVIILLAIRGAQANANFDLIQIAMGKKEYERCLAEIIRNAYSNDIHFLPTDGRAGDFSAMEQHSVALFRYPMALPVDVLQLAGDVAVTDWNAAIDSLKIEYPVAESVRVTRPMKVAALKSRFLPDLISRFASLHIRMGSPDFTSETIAAFVHNF